MLHPPMLVHPISLYRPWHARLGADLLDALRRIASRAGAEIAQMRARRLEREQWRAALELSKRTLHDIGAPDWLVSHAEAQRESRSFERRLMGLEPRSDLRHFR